VHGSFRWASRTKTSRAFEEFPGSKDSALLNKQETSRGSLAYSNYFLDLHWMTAPGSDQNGTGGAIILIGLHKSSSWEIKYRTQNRVFQRPAENWDDPIFDY
jgi:hypothetical protein